MKMTSRLALPILAALMLTAMPGAAAAADLTLSLVTRQAGGKIAVAIYRDADSFRRGEGAVRTMMVDRTGATTTVTITGLAPGRYCVAAFHDTDGNGRLSTWPVGLPKEAYGFSNNARGRFGPPSFASAVFDLGVGGGRQAITLR